MLNIILLSGGQGTRLWPLSSEDRPKQFLKVLKDNNGNKESMIQRTFRQIKEANIDANIVISTNKKQESLIKEQIKDNIDLVIEPKSQNTYPAILLSCAYLKYKKSINNDDSVIVLPIDPYTETSFFETLKDMDNKIQEGKYDLTLIGAKPNKPSSKYGYIECNQDNKVVKFIEKPNIDLANELIKKNTYWNAGVFGFKLSFITHMLNKYDSFGSILQHYNELPSISFDYEVVEKSKSINVIPYLGSWKDLGTWDDLSKEIDENIGLIYGDSNDNTLIINNTDIPIVASDIKDSVIVINEDGILITKKDNNLELKDYLLEIKKD